MRKIAITGASGMLGTAMLDCFAKVHSVFATSRSQGLSQTNIKWDMFDLLDFDVLMQWLNHIQPDVVIHCAAMVNVDACENQIDLARRTHAGTTEVISNTISKWGGRLIYISSDGVFDGNKKEIYIENDMPNPLSVYGQTKYEGEKVVLNNEKGIVLRTNIFGWNPKNNFTFAEWILKALIEKKQLNMFTDVFFTPIHVSHVADTVLKLLNTDLSGIYHITGNTLLSKYEFALRMASAFELSTDKILSSSIDEAGLVAKRPKNMALSNEKLSNALGCNFPTVDDGLDYLRNQYESGWVAKIKNRNLKLGYRFWEEECAI